MTNLLRPASLRVVEVTRHGWESDPEEVGGAILLVATRSPRVDVVVADETGNTDVVHLHPTAPAMVVEPGDRVRVRGAVAYWTARTRGAPVDVPIPRWGLVRRADVRERLLDVG